MINEVPEDLKEVAVRFHTCMVFDKKEDCNRALFGRWENQVVLSCNLHFITFHVVTSCFFHLAI